MIGAREEPSAGRPSVRSPSLRYQLPLLIGLLLLATVVLSGSWSYATTRRSLLRAAGAQIDSAVRELGTAMSAGVDAVVDGVEQVAATPAIVAALESSPVTDQAAEAAEAVLAELIDHPVRAVAAELWTLDGDRVLTAANPKNLEPSEALLDIGAEPRRPGLQPLDSFGATVFYEVIADVLAEPEEPESPVVGRLVVRQAVSSNPDTLNLVRTLIARDSVVLVGNRDGGVWTDLQHPVSPPPIDPLSGGPATYTGGDGEAKLGAGMPLAGTPWVLWAETSSATVLKPARVLLARVGLVSLTLLLLGGGGAWLISRRMTAPLHRASEAAERIALGSFEERLVEDGPAEVARLAESFNRMAENVEQRTNELRRARDEYEELYDRGPDLLLSIDVESGRVAECNGAAAERLGLSRDEIVGRTLAELCIAECVDRADDVVYRLAETGSIQNSSLTIRDARGRRIPVLLNASKPRHRDGGALESSVSLRDVSDVSRAESRRAAVVRGAMDAIITIDGEGRVMEYNPAAEAMFGYSSAEARGKPISDLVVPERHRKQHEEGIARVRETGEGPILGRRIEIEARRRDGSEFPVEITVVRLEGTDELMFTGFVRDLTPLRRAESELERTQAQLLQAQKLEAIGRLAGGVAHDFNNLLVVIIGYAELALAETPADGLLHKMIQEMRAAGGRAEKLTQQLLAFGRKQVMQPRAMNLNESIRRLTSMMDQVVREEIEQEQHLAPDLGTITADPGQIDQVLVNLVANASDAIQTRGKITLETRNIDLDADYAAAHESVTAGPHVLLSITDTGRGMDEQTVARIFDPFFSTKGHKGTGLGLATVYGIVKQSGGHIWVYSEPGRGTTFKVYFPRVAEPAEGPGPVATGEPRGGTETILVVEDDEAVGRFVMLALEHQGYRLLHASAAEDALGMLEEHDGPLDLLLTDVVMPGMSGPDLYGRVQLSHPGTKVLYTSGYTDDAIVHHGVLDPGTPFLTKPFSVVDLNAKLREVLDA